MVKDIHATWSYERAYEESIEYFMGDDLAAKVFLDKYGLRNNEGELLESTPEGMHWRLANEFGRKESTKFKSPLSSKKIFGLFDRFKYIVPQGSPMYGIGNDFQIISLSNCYVLESPLDSYSSILKVDEQLVSISKRRGGVGINLSNLRPNGTITRNAARTSTGISTWMERYSNSIREVGQSGRRGALMLVLDVRHPDIETFITIKNDSTKVTGANISVLVNRDFMKAVDENRDYQLQWPIDSKKPTITRTVKAKDLWNLMIKSAHNRAEPGILMWDNFMENGPADQYEKYRSVATNPCAEISLCSYDSCRLIALNLYSYVKNPFTKLASFDYELFSEHTQIAQRLMDDLVDLESEKIDKILKKIDSDPEPDAIKENERKLWSDIKWFNDNGRRTGLGITALGDTLAALGIKYASELGIETTEKIYKTLKLNAYRSSVDMAKELGAFTGYDAKIEENCPFIKRIAKEDPKLYADMVKYGRRNVAILTTAPTGSVSILTQTTSGIEPLFMLGYKRRKKVNPHDVNARVDFTDQNGDSWQEFMVYHPKFKVFVEANKDAIIEELKNNPQFTNTLLPNGDINLNHSMVQTYVEGISPWYGCTANEIDWKSRVMTQAVAQKHVCHSISSTLNLPNDVSIEKVEEIYRTAFDMGCKGITIYRDGCRTGVLVKNEPKENKTSRSLTKKRPKELPCDIYHVKVSKKLDKLRTFDYMVLIGLDEGVPYEVFAVENGKYDKKLTSGKIIRKSSGIYSLHFDGSDLVIENLAKDTTESEDALTRMISAAFACGGTAQFLSERLSKVEGELLGFSKCISRALKRYIKDGEKSSMKCDCGGDLIYQEGCVSCQACGKSKCG